MSLTGTTDLGRIEAPVTVKAYLICAFAAFGGIFFGYDTGWMSGVLGMKYFIKQYTGLEYPSIKFPDTTSAEYKDYKTNTFKLPAWEQSLITSILSAGTFFGAIAAGDIADFIGRRSTIILGCLIFTVGCILETASTSVGVMAAGRIICGAGVGFISAIVILYMSEIAPKKVRGALVSGYQFCITIGILLANCVVYGTQDRLGKLLPPHTLIHLLIPSQTLARIAFPLPSNFYGPSLSPLDCSSSQNPRVIMSKKGDSQMPLRLLDAFVASQSTRTISKTNLLKLSPTTSMRCKSFLSTAISSRGLSASAAVLPTALPTSVVRFLVLACK
jgi:MFS family permease